MVNLGEMLFPICVCAYLSAGKNRTEYLIVQLSHLNKSFRETVLFIALNETFLLADGIAWLVCFIRGTTSQ